MKQDVLNFRFENKKDFYVTSKNSLAFELIQKWPNWNNQFFFLYGPTKCGKTTICKIWQKKSNAILLNTKKISGLFNIGTGKAQTFYELAQSLIKNHQASIEQIKFIDMPSDLDGKYQYFTEAKIDKLIETGYDLHFNDLNSGVSDYYQNYLSQKDQYL